MWGQHIELDSDEDDERTPLNELAQPWSPMEHYIIQASDEACGFSARVLRREIEVFAPLPVRQMRNPRPRPRPRMVAPVPQRLHEEADALSPETRQSCDDVFNTYCGACFNVFRG